MNDPMSPRAVYICATLVLWLAFVLWMIATPLGIDRFGMPWLFAGPVFGLAGWLIRIFISCPGCGNPMTEARIGNLPWPFRWEAPWPPKRCFECGARLDIA